MNTIWISDWRVLKANQTNDAVYIAHALGVVARAKGMVQIARERQGS